ncbi:MAG: ABC transporter ATP-binding protein [Gammaproteobacteria bacterium]|nr:MAG: ABC transporter ATP-binding protein [Gammaproteobacteria bacterium]
MSSNDKASALSGDKTTLSAWLRAEAGRFAKSQRLLVVLTLLAILLQFAALWMLSDFAQTWLMDKQPLEPGQFIVFAVLWGLQLSMLRIRDAVRSRFADRVLQYYQSALHQKLDERSLALIRQYSTAQWQSFFNRRIPALKQYFTDYRPQIYLSVLVPLVVILIVLPISWLVALILFITAPLVPLFMILVGMGAAAAHRSHFVALERLGSLFLDRLRARQLLTVFNRVNTERGFFQNASSELKARTLKVVSMAFLSSSVLDFFATVSMALVAVFVGFSLLGEVTFGHWSSGLSFQEGLFLLLLAPLFFAELKTLGRLYHQKAEAEGAADELRSVLSLAPLAVTPTELPLSIAPCEVMSVDGAQRIVSLPALVLHKGDKVLLSGASGNGKTTVFEALMGLRPISGAASMACLKRDDVAWLDQSPPVLPGTVRENLLLGEQFDDDKLRGVLAQVGLSEWLSNLDAGLGTPMGDYPPLSGGQRQRLAVARLLLENPGVVLLDEPTAHLAPAQRDSITELLTRHLADKTVLWIAHGLSIDDFFTHHWLVDESGVLSVSGEGGDED